MIIDTVITLTGRHAFLGQQEGLVVVLGGLQHLHLEAADLRRRGRQDAERVKGVSVVHILVQVVLRKTKLLIEFF